jgi:hypothetical protein
MSNVNFLRTSAFQLDDRLLWVGSARQAVVASRPGAACRTSVKEVRFRTGTGRWILGETGDGRHRRIRLKLLMTTSEQGLCLLLR